ncbi:hypothetical protein EV651_118155 [Kribbella sp. VKM Ac-2571]|uniref:hypothetical protein n=1 Tax=Kribbella sp. VKM Ac-2571 TaxID=2512222 RepID=UPI00105F2509|nr:hypothetical protein [Kribbella sp. VKM Ac-2571]TDO52133.1 hypothetical protein EV651_118155 [Kribbella sp. VKM Ac-2571]
MNTELEPPPVAPLTTAERARLRNRVMDKTRPAGPHPARRWIAPAVGVAAITAVAAGTLVVTNRPSDDSGVAGRATAAAPTAARTGLEVVPDAEATVAFVKSCERRLHVEEMKQPFTVVWARRVPGKTSKATDILMIVKGSGASGIASCLTPSGGGIWQKDPSGWTKPPTQKQGLAGLTGGTYSTSEPKPESRIWMLYRARPEIARVESRYVSNGAVGPWQRGYVDSGYAYADNRTNSDLGAGDLRQEVRAYDAQGRVVPIQAK